MVKCVSDVTLHLPELSPGGHCWVYNNTLTGELRCVWGEESVQEPLCVFFLFFFFPRSPTVLLLTNYLQSKDATLGSPYVVYNCVGTQSYNDSTSSRIMSRGSICILAADALQTPSLL